MPNIEVFAVFQLDARSESANLFPVETGDSARPALIKLYIRNVLLGFAIAAAFVGMLLWFDVMNLWSLVSNSEVGVIAVFILWFMNGIVFAGVQFGFAIMSMAEDQGGPRGGTPVAHELKPVPVRAEATAQGAKRQLHRK
jgi:hypothetical protein